MGKCIYDHVYHVDAHWRAIRLYQISMTKFRESKIKYENKIFNLNGQIASIKKLTSFISYIYNSRGLIIDKLHIDVISEDLISIDLDLIY